MPLTMNPSNTPVRFGRISFPGQIPAMLLLTASLALGEGVTGLRPGLREKIDATVRQVLSSSGVPSASIAVVQDGRVAMLQAYGDARLEPRIAAKASMRYSIGSISKQFTAAA